MTEQDNKTIKVVLVEPNKEARIADIKTGLEDLQEIVQGCIQTYYPFDEDVCIVCNDEGKLIGLPPNRAIRQDNGEIADIICGPFFICDCSGECFASLNEEQLNRYGKQFRYPQRFVSVNGKLAAIPFRPRTEPMPKQKTERAER